MCDYRFEGLVAAGLRHVEDLELSWHHSSWVLQQLEVWLGLFLLLFLLLLILLLLLTLLDLLWHRSSIFCIRTTLLIHYNHLYIFVSVLVSSKFVFIYQLSYLSQVFNNLSLSEKHDQTHNNHNPFFSLKSGIIWQFRRVMSNTIVALFLSAVIQSFPAVVPLMASDLLGY